MTDWERPPRQILIVDDEPHIGMLLRLQLEQRGYSLRLARTLAEARAALTNPPDALLLDLHLPDGSGVDLLRDLRRAPATGVLPVMVLTAEGEERVLDEARALGASLVTKPFSPTKLGAQIQALLGDAPPLPPDAEP